MNTALEVCDLHAPANGPGTALPALAGELDGAFDAIVHRRLPPEGPQRAAQLAECWRLLSPGGAMAILLAAPSGHHDPREDPRLPRLEAELAAIAEGDPAGVERMERVRVHARCGVLVRRGFEDLDELDDLAGDLPDDLPDGPSGDGDSSDRDGDGRDGQRV
jgi:hypothetical protein